MCGIFAIYSKEPISINETLEGLKKLQHRGKDGFGIAYNYNNSIKFKKHIGLIENIDIGNCESNISIGHVRYST